MSTRIILLLLICTFSQSSFAEDCMTQEQIDNALQTSNLKSKSGVKVQLLHSKFNSKSGFHDIEYTVTANEKSETHSLSIAAEECAHVSDIVISTVKNSTLLFEDGECKAKRKGALKVAHGLAAPLYGLAIAGVGQLLADGVGDKSTANSIRNIGYGLAIATPFIPAIMHIDGWKHRAKYLGVTYGTWGLAYGLQQSEALPSSSNGSNALETIAVVTAATTIALAPGAGMAWALNSECKGQME